MAREITSVKDAEFIDSARKPSSYKERLLKLIPSEIITAYVAVNGLIKGFDGNNTNNLLWIVMAILVLLTPLYLVKVSGVTKKNQILFSTISFVVWAFATTPPVIPGYTGIPLESISSIVLIILTLFIPLLYKG